MINNFKYWNEMQFNNLKEANGFKSWNEAEYNKICNEELNTENIKFKNAMEEKER